MKQLDKIAYEVRDIKVAAGMRERIDFLGRSVRCLEASEKSFMLSVQGQGYNLMSAGLQVNTADQFDYVELLNHNNEDINISLAFSQSGIDDNRLTVSGTLNAEVKNFPKNQLVTVDNHLPALDRRGYKKIGDYASSSVEVAGFATLINGYENINGVVLRSLSISHYNSIFSLLIENTMFLRMRQTVPYYNHHHCYPNIFIPAGKSLRFTVSKNHIYSSVSVTYDKL